MTTRFTRRALVAAMGALGCGLPPEEGPVSELFPLGVASGDVTPDGALLWTKFVGRGDVEVRLSSLGEADRRFVVTVAEGGFVRAEVGGLTPGATYHYEFIASERGVELARSGPGRFRAALAPDALAPLSIGASSCARQTTALDALTRAATELPMDAFLMLGDAVYVDYAAGLGAPVTRADYRAKWAEGLRRRPNRLLRASTSLIATWDDHEVVNNASGDVVDPKKFADARGAFFEHQPVRHHPSDDARIWRSFRWGRTAEFFVLDCRSERNHEREEYLSAAQLSWLKEGLASSDAVFKVILNSVPVSAFDGPFFQLFDADRWEGFGAQRRELLEFIDQTPVSGVLWVAGDFHFGFIGRVALQGPGATQLEVGVGPAAQGQNPAPSYPGPPQFDFASGLANVVLFDFEPVAGTVRVRFFTGDTHRTLADQTYTLT